jgi:hypothetical protein
VFGVTGSSSPVSALTVVFGITTFFLASVLLHLAARYVLKGLKP